MFEPDELNENLSAVVDESDYDGRGYIGLGNAYGRPLEGWFESGIEDLVGLVRVWTVLFVPQSHVLCQADRRSGQYRYTSFSPREKNGRVEGVGRALWCRCAATKEQSAPRSAVTRVGW